MKITLDERKTPTKNSHTVSQRSPTLHNILCITKRNSKSTLHNLVENPEALGFHQEQMETMEDSTEITGKIRIQKEEYPRIGFVSNLLLFT